MNPCCRRHRGFALIVVLWALAGLTVVAVAVASSLRVSAEGLKALRDRVRAEAAFLSAQSRVLAAVAPASAAANAYGGARGLVLADGRPLQVDATDQWVRVQDLRGLVQLNRPSPQRLSRFLAGCGASQSTISSLVDSLLDYTDADALKRLNGAEAFEYASTDLPRPRDADLLSRDELWRIHGWAELRQPWSQRGCMADVTVHGDGLFNRNTATRRALLADGLNEVSASNLIAAREGGLTDLTLTTPPNDAPNPFGVSAGGGRVGPGVRLTHSAGWVEWGLEADVVLTPSRPGGPWRLLEVRIVDRPAAESSGSGQLPSATHWDPARDRELDDAASSLPFAG